MHTKSSTSLVHAPPSIIASCILSNFSETLEAGALTASVPCVVAQGVSTLLFFVTKIKTGQTSKSGKPVLKNFAFHALFEAAAADADGASEDLVVYDLDGETGEDPFKLLTSTTLPITSPAPLPSSQEDDPFVPPQRFTFRSLNRAEVANLAPGVADKDAMATAAKLLLKFSERDEGIPPSVANLTGTITLEPRLHGCTQVTVEASMSARNESEPAVNFAETSPKTEGKTGTQNISISSANNLALSPSFSRSKATENIPVEQILEHVICAVPNLHARYARCEEVDQACLLHFENSTVPSAPPPKPHEIELVARSALINSSNVRQQFRRLSNTVNDAVECFQKTASGEGNVGKAVADVDASIHRVLGWFWMNMSYERIEEHVRKNGFLLRKEFNVPNSFHSKIIMAVHKFPANLDNRLYSIMWTWVKEADGSFTVGFADTDDCEQFGAAAMAEANRTIATHKDAVAAVRASTKGVVTIKPLAPNVCRVTLVQQGFVGGSIPLIFVNFRLKKALGVVVRLHEKFERSCLDVDSEVREAMPLPPLLDDLQEDQRELVAECLSLEAAGSGSLIKMKSSDVFVKMSMLYEPPKKREGLGRSVALGVAEAVVDGSARRVSAWYFEYCGRERKRISAEKRDLARIVVQRRSHHDATFATVKRFPFPLSKREFVFRVVTTRNEGGSYLVASSSTDRDFVVDYGATFKAIRGSTTALLKIEPLGPNSCKCVFFQILDGGGFLPVFVVNRKVSSQLRSLSDLRNVFQRDDEVDAALLAPLARVLREEQQNYSPAEQQMMGRVDQLDDLTEAGFSAIESPDHFVSMFVNHLLKGNSVGKGSVVVDGTVEDLAVWEMCKSSRANSKKFALSRSYVKENDHSFVYQVVYDLVPGFQPREWVVSQMWKWKNPETLKVFFVSIDHADFPVLEKTVRAESVGYYLYEKLPRIAGTPQTRVSLFQRVDLMGNIPRRFADRNVKGQLMNLSKIRKKFDRSAAIDASNMSRNAEMIRRHSDRYTKAETKMLDEGNEVFLLFGVNSKPVPTSSPATTAKIEYQKGQSLAWGWASTSVRGSPEDVLGFIWDTLKRASARDDDLEKAVDEAPNGHNQLIYIKKAFKKPLSNRDFLTRAVWRKTEYGFLYVLKEEESERRRRLPGIVRAKLPSAIKLTRVGGQETRLEYALQLDFGGSLPVSAMNLLVAKNLNRATEVQQTFQSLRGMERWDAEDGHAIGEIMVIRTKAEKHRDIHNKGETAIGARVRELFKKYKGLREIGEKHEFFQAMMTRVVENKLRPGGDVGAKLLNLSVLQGVKIGAGLSMSLVSNLTAESAVEEWVDRYPALRELDREEIWFRPLMNCVALRLLGEVSWGLKMRVYVGAGLSITDMASDAYIIGFYLSNPLEEKYGWYLLAMLLSCILLQLMFVYAQNRAKPMVAMREMLIVLTGLKSAVDASRVASGAELMPGMLFDPKTELTAGKCAELLAESIPGEATNCYYTCAPDYIDFIANPFSISALPLTAGCILQCYVLLKSERITKRAVTSIVISAATAGFASASISFE
jgi:hypothetical protein